MSVLIHSNIGIAQKTWYLEEQLGILVRQSVAEVQDIHPASFYLLCNGKILHDDDIAASESVVYPVLRVNGGKGGFGSMLRAIGAQIEKTTNNEACRDLSGRRLRDINDEKRLQKWISQQAEREREVQERKMQRLERLRAEPKHEFQDPEYYKQRSELCDNIHDALNQGLKNAATSSACSSSSSDGVAGQKRKSNDKSSKKKKFKSWIGIDDVDSAEDSEMEDQCSQSDIESGESQNIKMTTKMNDREPKCSSSTSCAATAEINPARKISDVGSPTESNLNRVDTTEESPSSETTEINDGKLVEKNNRQTVDTTEHEEINLTDYKSVDELRKLGLDRLKLELMNRGLKCGGTLQQRSERLWSIRGLEPERIPQSLRAKPK